jgi:hypothetical protein
VADCKNSVHRSDDVSVSESVREQQRKPARVVVLMSGMGGGTGEKGIRQAICVDVNLYRKQVSTRAKQLTGF